MDNQSLAWGSNNLSVWGKQSCFSRSVSAFKDTQRRELLVPALQPVLGMSQPGRAARVLNPAPAGKLYTAACSRRGTSVVKLLTNILSNEWLYCKGYM